MRKLSYWLIMLFGLLMNEGFAGVPTRELSPKEAVKLIASRSDLQENTVEISFIVDGKSKSDCFDVEHVRRVAAIHGVREDGMSRRKLVFYDVFWNESLGWFMWEKRDERTGEAVYLWSEFRGETVNR